MRLLDTLFLWWENAEMLDLNDLRVFERRRSSAEFLGSGARA